VAKKVDAAQMARNDSCHSIDVCLSGDVHDDRYNIRPEFPQIIGSPVQGFLVSRGKDQSRALGG
jgi:hypothetical protein